MLSLVGKDTYFHSAVIHLTLRLPQPCRDFFLCWLVLAELHHPQWLVHSCHWVNVQETFMDCCLPRHSVDGHQEENWTHCWLFQSEVDSMIFMLHSCCILVIHKCLTYVCINVFHHHSRCHILKWYSKTMLSWVLFFYLSQQLKCWEGCSHKLKKNSTHCWLFLMLYLLYFHSS